MEKKTDIRVPGEDLLPWTVTERQLRMDGPSRMAKVSGFAISGTMERGGVTFNAEVSVGVTGVVGDLPPPWDVYRYVPVYLFRNQGFYMAQLYIDGQRVHHPTALSGECDPAGGGRGVHREHAAGRLSQHH